MVSLSRVITLSDHFRLATSDFSYPNWYKEWHHFCVFGPNIQVILNFNLGYLAASAAEDLQVARVILLVRQENSWIGDIDTIPLRDVHTRRGKIRTRFGHNIIDFQNDHYLLSVALERLPITLNLASQPLTYPLVRSKAVLGEGKIDWVVVPRLVSSGTIAVGQQVYQLEQAPTYHDHNWGHWLWGQDFAWQWGFMLPTQRDTPWSVIFNSVTDRARNEARDLKVSLWKHEKFHRLFMYDEIRVEQSGYLEAASLPKFPSVMSLVSTERTTDIPRRMTITARRDSDWLTCHFEAKDAAQIVIPNETDLEVTVINEVSGEMSMNGWINGEKIDVNGKSFFEFLT